MAERNARRKHIARRPERQLVLPDVPEGNDDRENQATVEDAARTREREQLRWGAPELIEVDDEEQQLRTDERRDDDVDAEVEHAVRVEATRFRARHCEPQSQEIGRGQEDAVGVDRDRSDAKQLWIHGCRVRKGRES
jgi:hypothetical protein